MDTSIASVVSLKNYLISISQTLVLIIGNYVIKITSRRVIAKLLLRLPSNFFPRYRLVVSPAIIENNMKVRKSMGCYVKEEFYSDTSSDDLEENYCRCCMHCQRKLFLDHQSEIDDNYEATENDEETFIVDLSRVAECSTPNIEFANNLDKETQYYIPPPPPMPESTRAVTFTPIGLVPKPPKLPELSPLEHIPSTPPLRRITVQELKSVKLRPSEAFKKTPKTPEVNDMLQVLRKRYAVMRFSFNSEHSGEGDSIQLVSF